MPLFRKSAPQDPLIVAMTGARLGHRVLVLMADDAEMPVDLAAKVGLSGQTVVAAASTDAVARVSGRAERRGVLVEAAVLETPIPYGDATFDIVVADDRRQPVGTRTTPALLADSFRVARPGGRLVILRPVPRSSWFLSREPASNALAGLRSLEQELVAAGFRAVREIGTREGTRFVEAARSALS